MMPVVFIGHGSPMNAIETNEYTQGWKEIATFIPKPSAILCISAHWVTKGTRVLTSETPETLHDFYGFPKALYQVGYKVNGSPSFAEKTIDLLSDIAIEDNSWGIDHGTWSVLNVMYPNTDIPTYQMSINQQASPEELFQIGSRLKPLREQGVLILGSGNIVHNLGRINFPMAGGFEWATRFDTFIQSNIIKRDYISVVNYKKLGDIAKYSVPTSEHFDPILYILGATDHLDKLNVYNHSCMAGSLSMTSFLFAHKFKKYTT